ncbi:hypothetical protein BGW80DRAFT_1308915 [Lactifluus volemus]|nr:hypothetical protein BGW80DRAFT_1308915 [Lactifluus volemus]
MPGPLFRCSVDFRSLLRVQHVTLPKTFGDVKPGPVVIFPFPRLLVNLLPPSEQSFPRTPVSITCLVIRSD